MGEMEIYLYNKAIREDKLLKLIRIKKMDVKLLRKYDII